MHIAENNDSFRVLHVNKWLIYADIFIYDNACYFGDAKGQTVYLQPTDVYEIPYPVNASELYFMNATSGANTKIVIVGVEMSDKQINNLLGHGLIKTV